MTVRSPTPSGTYHDKYSRYMGGKRSHLTRGGLQNTLKQGKHCYTLKAVLNLQESADAVVVKKFPVMGMERRAEPV